EAASNHEQSYHRLRRVFGNHQRVSLSGGFEDVSSGLRNPVMLKVSPVTAHRIAMNGPNMVVSSHHRTREAFQNDAESSRGDVKAAGLEPDTIRVRNPETVIFQVEVRYEVFAAPSTRIEAVGETAKGSDWHKYPFIVRCWKAPTFSQMAQVRPGLNSKYRPRPSTSRRPAF